MQLSYYDLFQFLEKRLNIKMENWQEDALESRLDKLGMAFIEFNEFNEFAKEFNIDFGVDLEENDLESKLEEKLNRSYKDYTLSKDDYFQGCETMLNSEKAALAKVRQIYAGLKQKKNHDFIDNDFGPKNNDKTKDSHGHIHSLYTWKNNKVP
jgi:hypothetical protein